MDNSELLNVIERIICDVTGEEIKISSEITAKDVSGWNSLAHIRILLALEEELKIKFNMDDINSIRNVGDIISIIKERS